MPTSSVGAINKLGGRRGVTLIEMMIVVTLLAVAAGLTYPSVTGGLEGLRLRSAASSIAGFLNTALTRAEKKQQVIELWISPGENAMTARSPDQTFVRRLEIPLPAQIVSIRPEAPVRADEPRRFLLYPGGTVPHIVIELAISGGRRRSVTVDPVTSAARIEVEVLK
jgi:prepilin-type N-terminal cleavage/methylation domain-containing protein